MLQPYDVLVRSATYVGTDEYPNDGASPAGIANALRTGIAFSSVSAAPCLSPLHDAQLVLAQGVHVI